MSVENTPPLVALIVKIACWLLSVKIAFSWITPKSFFSLILFLIVWGVVGIVIDFVAVVILTALFGKR